MDKLPEKLNLKKDFPEVSYEDWKKVVENDLKGQPFDKNLITATYEGIDIKPIYNKEDIEEINFLNSKPGFINYVRGTRASGYLYKVWNVHQEIPYVKPADFNNAILDVLERGQNCIVINPNKITISNSPISEHYTHTDDSDGISIYTSEDFEIALKSIDLTAQPVYINAGFDGIPLFSLFIAFLKKYNIDFKKISGGVIIDPYSYLIHNGSLPLSFKDIFGHLSEIIRWAEKNLGDFKIIGISSLEYHNSGASAVQELAYAFSTAVDYFNNLLDMGIDIDTIASRTRFSFGVGSFYFMEIAKLRAARILWQKIVASYGGNEDSQKIDILAVTSKYNQTVRDPYVNMLRTTTEAFSSILGGADAIQTNPFNEVFSLTDEFSRRIARNTQIILQEEANLYRLIDPAGGSYYIETLTSEIAEAVWKLFREIQSQGGMLEALKNNIPQNETEKVHRQRINDYSKRKSIIVGVNLYANPGEEKPEMKRQNFGKIYSELYKQYVSGRSKIEKNKLFNLLSELKNSEENIFEKAIECALMGASREDISNNIFKSFEELKIRALKPVRASEIFEILRDVTDDIKDETGKTPSVFLASMGPVKQHKARADFSRGFLEVAGLNVIYKKGYEKAEEAVSDAVKSGAKAIVICSTDETYTELVPQITTEVKKQSPGMLIILAGYPKKQIESLKSSGVEEFIFMGADVYATLNRILKRLI